MHTRRHTQANMQTQTKAVHQILSFWCDMWMGCLICCGKGVKGISSLTWFFFFFYCKLHCHAKQMRGCPNRTKRMRCRENKCRGLEATVSYGNPKHCQAVWAGATVHITPSSVRTKPWSNQSMNCYCSEGRGSQCKKIQSALWLLS